MEAGSRQRVEPVSYRIVSEVNMAKRMEGRTESPVATFLRVVSELKEGEGVLLILDDPAFPTRAAEALAKRMGLDFECSGKEGTWIIASPTGELESPETRALSQGRA